MTRIKSYIKEVTMCFAFVKSFLFVVDGETDDFARTCSLREKYRYRCNKVYELSEKRFRLFFDYRLQPGFLTPSYHISIFVSQHQYRSQN